MMRKERPFDDHTKVDTSRVIGGDQKTGLDKQAHQVHIPSPLQEAIGEIRTSDHPDYVFVYDRALGCGERYGPNNNGDFFGRDELKSNHDTFVTEGGLYRHHQSNSDPIGEIIVSAFNDPVDSVDVIFKAPRSEVESDLKKLEDGQILSTSMGATVDHDVCNICGNKASSRTRYCKHLKNQMLDIFDDGRQVYAKNPDPTFKDLSIVVVPADPISGCLAKVASPRKSADMKKIEPAGDDHGYSEEGSPRLAPQALEALYQACRSKGEAIKTASCALDRPLSPDEFQALMRKDASALRPHTIPFVTRTQSGGRQLSGRPIMKTAQLIRQVDRVPLEKHARREIADFLTREEKRAYNQYRRYDVSQAFMR